MKRTALIALQMLLTIICRATDLTPEQFYSGTGDYTKAIQTCIDESSRTGQKIRLSGNEYLVKGGELIIKSNVTMYSKCGSRIYTNDHNNYRSIIFQDISHVVDNVVIDGLFFDQSLEVNSPYPSSVEYFVILLYKATNVKITNCKFHHVGTNCIVVNGSECRGSIIIGNELFFERLKDAPHYDVSSIYIEDSKHTICKNHVFNDGLEQNKQGGGIETHGTIGNISNNVIENCAVAINVVGFSGTSTMWDGTYDRTISKNISLGCDNFVVFWPITNHDIRNVVIKKNLAKGLRCAIRVQPGVDLQGRILEVAVANNKFESNPHEFVDERDASKLDHLLYYEGISIQNFGNVSMTISKNTFSNFPGIMLDLNAYARDVQTNVTFCKNKLINCFCGSVKEALTLQSKFAFFSVGPHSNLIAEKNIIDIPSIDASIPPYYIYGNKEGSISIMGNKFKNMALTYTNTEYGRIKGYISKLQDKNYIGKVYKKSIPASFNKGDVVIVGKSKKQCTQQGTLKNVRLTNGVIHGGFVVYLTCENSANIEVGDWLVFKGQNILEQARQVAAIADGRIYLKEVNFKLTLGKTVTLTKLEFYPYKLEDM